MEIKENLRKTWNFLWNDDSLLSWIVSLIVAFIFVKFIFFPILSLVLGSSLPLVIVESQSMYHDSAGVFGFIGNAIGTQGSFDAWWEKAGAWYMERGIVKEEADKWGLRTGLTKGDIVLVFGRGDMEVGDIIIFNANQRKPIIHRIINITLVNGKTVYSTKGDNNIAQHYFEEQIPDDAIIGKAILRVPKLGWLKLVFVELLN